MAWTCIGRPELSHITHDGVLSTNCPCHTIVPWDGIWTCSRQHKLSHTMMVGWVPAVHPIPLYMYHGTAWTCSGWPELFYTLIVGWFPLSICTIAWDFPHYDGGLSVMWDIVFQLAAAIIICKFYASVLSWSKKFCGLQLFLFPLLLLCTKGQYVLSAAFCPLLSQLMKDFLLEDLLKLVMGFWHTSLDDKHHHLYNIWKN